MKPSKKQGNSRPPLKLLRLIRKYFPDQKRIECWFYIPNLELNGMRPIDYKIDGKWDALEKTIIEALKEIENE